MVGYERWVLFLVSQDYRSGQQQYKLLRIVGAEGIYGSNKHIWIWKNIVNNVHYFLPFLDSSHILVGILKIMSPQLSHSFIDRALKMTLYFVILLHVYYGRFVNSGTFYQLTVQGALFVINICIIF